MVAITEVVSRLELEDPRRATETVHRTMRELIYSGALPAGLIISQVELSEAFGVSRTPTREAMRMLQEEGLIDAEPNRRCRVAGFNATDVDATCGSRIMLESLAMTVTLRQMDQEIQAIAANALQQMEDDDRPGISPEWHEAHRRFHRAFTSGAPQALRLKLDADAERADRYVRQLAQGVPTGWSHGRDDHRRIMQLVNEWRIDEAILSSCQHFARTAVTLLADASPEFEPATTRTAIRMVAQSLGLDVSQR